MKIRLVLIALLAALAASGSTKAAVPGDAAPPLALPTASGETLSLDKLRGKVVYVDFWASWCGPCKRSFPFMNELTQKYGSRGLTVLAVNVDKKRADAERFLQQVPAQFAIVYDPAGRAPAAFGVAAMPSSYVLDASGKVVLAEEGFRDERKGEIEERIRGLLK